MLLKELKMSLNKTIEDKLIEKAKKNPKYNPASGKFSQLDFGKLVIELLERDDTYPFIVFPNLSTEEQDPLQRKVSEGMNEPNYKDEERKWLESAYMTYFSEPATKLLEGDGTYQSAGKQISVSKELIERVKSLQKKDKERQRLVDANHHKFCRFLEGLGIQTKSKPPRMGMYFLTLNRQQVDELNKSTLVQSISVDYPTDLMYVLKNQK